MTLPCPGYERISDLLARTSAQLASCMPSQTEQLKIFSACDPNYVQTLTYQAHALAMAETFSGETKQ